MGQKLWKGSLPSDPPLALKHQFSLSTISTYSCQEQMSLAVAAMGWLWWIGETCSSWVFSVSIWAQQKKTAYMPQTCWLFFPRCVIYLIYYMTSFHQKPFSQSLQFRQLSQLSPAYPDLISCLLTFPARVAQQSFSISHISSHVWRDLPLSHAPR